MLASATSSVRPAETGMIHAYANSLANNRSVQAIVCLISLTALLLLAPQSAHVRCGLQLRDIVLKGSPDYDSLQMRERYFPVYNTFIVTQDSFDYAANQRLLFELHRRVQQVEGVISANDDESAPSASGGKFWLAYFRDWLLELQDSFDADRNRSAISREGWSPNASDAAKLAYKLLAQTGRLDNPVDRNLVETNRLVDKNGLINQRAFYYYLTAWVMNDAFTYSNSEANFRPEPKTWNENAEELRIERARPLSYAQMPFLLKLSEESDNLKTILEIRAISQAYNQLDLANFPTGVPFIFWDQFVNLDLLFICAFVMLTVTHLSIAYLVMANLKLSLVLVVPSLFVVVELYSLLGLFSFHFNTIVAVILIGSIATSTTQTAHFIMNFQNERGTMTRRICRMFAREFRTMVASLTLLMISACIFMNSKIDFMIKYSNMFLCLAAMNCFNSLVLTPVLLALFAPSRDGSAEHEQEDHDDGLAVVTKSHPGGKSDLSSIVKSHSDKMQAQSNKQPKQKKKKKSFARVQSEISLSTISEEP